MAKGEQKSNKEKKKPKKEKPKGGEVKAPFSVKTAAGGSSKTKP